MLQDRRRGHNGNGQGSYSDTTGARLPVHVPDRQPSKSATMREWEASDPRHRDLASYLPALLTQVGIERTAKELGIPVSTVNSWRRQLGAVNRMVCVPAGYRLMLVPEGYGVELRAE